MINLSEKTITWPKVAPKKPTTSEQRVQDLNEFTGFMLFFYLVPILLLTFRVLPMGSHNIVIPLMGLVTFSYALEKGINFKKLGFRKDNLRPAMLTSLALSITFAVMLITLKKINLITTVGNETTLFFFYYVFISAPIQEFIFRSLIFYELGLFLGKKRYFLARIILSALIFGFAHAFYHNWLVLVLTTVTGLVWGYMYWKRPNFYALALSHAILGAVAVFLGLV